MIKELYKVNTVETTLNVTNNQIDSVRNKNITKSACRVYDGQYIGIAGTLGDETAETWKQAEENLKLKVLYNYEPAKGIKRTRDLCDTTDTADFVANSEKLVEQLHTEFPDFIFSNKMIMSKTTVSLSNDAGLDIASTDCLYMLALTVKHVTSVNIFDTVVARNMRKWEAKEFLDEVRAQLTAFKKDVELPKTDKVLVAVSASDIGMKLVEYLHARTLGKGTSPLASKLGEKLFSDRLTVHIDRSSNNFFTPFFDSEGSMLDEDRCALIENGVLLRGFSDKMHSAEFGYENTASAGGDYDDVPTLSPEGLCAKYNNETFAQLVNDKYWIFIAMMSGGDCTNEGDFSSPVQLSYLMKGTEYVGKLPEYTLSGNLYDYFGDDYVGTSSDIMMYGEHGTLVYMKAGE